jgi:hypothetical protein
VKFALRLFFLFFWLAIVLWSCVADHFDVLATLAKSPVGTILVLLALRVLDAISGRWLRGNIFWLIIIF